MKHLLLTLMLVVLGLPQAIAAEAAITPTFVLDATTGLSRAAFDAIARYYTRGFPPGKLTPSKSRPVRIVFSESDATDVKLERTYKSASVSGTASINAKQVELAVDDTDAAANKAREKDPNTWVKIGAAKLSVTSGKYECAGKFSVNGKKIVIISGETEVTSADGPVTFSAGAQAEVDGQIFTYQTGKWVPSPASSAGT